MYVFRDAENNKTFHTRTVHVHCACHPSQRRRSQNNIRQSEKRAIPYETGNGHLELPCLIHLCVYTCI